MTILRVSDPLELLSYIPYQLGFQPSESVVVLGMRANGRVGLTVRLDLDDLYDPESRAEVCAQLPTHFQADAATRTMIVFYTPYPWNPETDPSEVVLLDAKHQQVLQDLREAFSEISAEDVWVIYDEYCVRIEPVLGRLVDVRPATELQSTQTSAHMVMRGVQIMASREELARLPQFEDCVELDFRFRLVMSQRADAPPNLVPEPSANALKYWLALLDEEGPYAPTLKDPAMDFELSEVAFAAGLYDTAFRDAVVVSLVPGAADVANELFNSHDLLPDEAVSADVDEAVGRTLAIMLDAEKGQAPPRTRAQRATSYLERCAALAHEQPRVACLTILGLLAWWAGDGARAGVRVDQALSLDPNYRLAQLLEQVIHNGLAPGWARRAGRSAQSSAPLDSQLPPFELERRNIGP